LFIPYFRKFSSNHNHMIISGHSAS
jgi:hypothetical protein